MERLGLYTSLDLNTISEVHRKKWRIFLSTCVYFGFRALPAFTYPATPFPCVREPFSTGMGGPLVQTVQLEEATLVRLETCTHAALANLEHPGMREQVRNSMKGLESLKKTYELDKTYLRVWKLLWILLNKMVYLISE